MLLQNTPVNQFKLAKTGALVAMGKYKGLFCYTSWLKLYHRAI